jgi:predicted DsbA family dithiol-disulfide isomerase
VRIDAIQRTYHVDIKYVHFPLHPETPADGRTLEALFNTNAEEITAKNAHMKGLMEAEGLPYGVRTHTYNSRLAQELAAWAVTQPGGEAIHDALYRAYFVDGKNVAEKEVLLAAAQTAGLDIEMAGRVVDERLYRDHVDADWNKSRQYGVTGVPTYVSGTSGVVGAQPYEAIEQLIVNAGAVKRTA